MILRSEGDGERLTGSRSKKLYWYLEVSHMEELAISIIMLARGSTLAPPEQKYQRIETGTRGAFENCLCMR